MAPHNLIITPHRMEPKVLGILGVSALAVTVLFLFPQDPINLCVPILALSKWLWNDALEDHPIAISVIQFLFLYATRVSIHAAPQETITSIVGGMDLATSEPIGGSKKVADAVLERKVPSKAVSNLSWSLSW